jgi:hypothetical protein
MAGILKVDKYQDFNGNDIMTSDGAVVTITLSSGMNTAVAAGTNNTPAFLVAAKLKPKYCSCHTEVELTWGTEYVDTDNAFANQIDLRFQAGKAGLYWFTLTVQFNGTASGGGTGPGIRRFDSSGNPYTSGGGNADGTLNLSYGTNGFNMAVTYQMEVGDYVKAVVYQANGTQTTYAPRTFFGGHKIIT